MTLIKRAALQPGGQNFDLAIQKLNHYFEGTSLQDYMLNAPARAYLETQLAPPMLRRAREPQLGTARYPSHRRLHDVLWYRQPGCGHR